MFTATNMGKVKYATGIDYVRGSLAKPKVKAGHQCGTYLIGTHRVAATENPDCTRLYVREAGAYKRTTALSTNEVEIRNRFTAVQAAVKTRATSLQHMTADQEAFEAQRYAANGKKTMKAYLWQICGAEYDAQHPRG